MLDPEDFDFVCPHRVCHKRQTGDAHTICNMGGEINRLKRELDASKQRETVLSDELLDAHAKLSMTPDDGYVPPSGGLNIKAALEGANRAGFSQFIRNASPEEKEKVYTEVMQRASEKQKEIKPPCKGDGADDGIDWEGTK